MYTLHIYKYCIYDDVHVGSQDWPCIKEGGGSSSPIRETDDLTELAATHSLLTPSASWPPEPFCLTPDYPHK